jgi:hypothetical protein
MLYYLLDCLELNPCSESGNDTFADTRVVYDCTRALHTQESINTGIWDALGYFRPNELDAIYLRHMEIAKESRSLNCPYPVLLDIVAIHEYAHMVHCRMNQSKYGINEVGFASREHYVECWANWCTYFVCESLGSPYLEVFENLNAGQSEPYHEWKKFEKWPVEEMVGLFLSEKGWYNLLEKGLIRQLENWDDEVVDWVVANWKEKSSVYALARSWGSGDFRRIIGDRLDLSEEERQDLDLVGGLTNLGV